MGQITHEFVAPRSGFRYNQSKEREARGASSTHIERETKMNTKAIGLLALIAASTIAAAGEPVSGSIAIREGDMVDGSTVTGLGAPFTNGNGELGAVLTLDDGRRAIWIGTGVVFTSDLALPDNVTGGESTMGIGNNGEFIYSPSYNGDDSVWGQGGLILAEPMQAPGYADGFNVTFNSRPQMVDDGSGYWVAGINDGAGGTSTVERALFRSNPNGTIDRIFGAGDAIANSGGLTIAAGSGVDFDYHVSGDGNHMINVFDGTSAAASFDLVAVNGSMVAREGQATGQGDNWDNFDALSINNNGNYVFSGDTDGNTASDEFIAYNNQIMLRQGMSVDGFTLGGGVDALSINNLDQTAFIWDTVEGSETLFFNADPTSFADAIALLSIGDLFDADNDGIGEWIIDDFNASTAVGPGLDFAEDGLLYVEVDLASLDGGTNIEAIISLAVPTPGATGILALAALTTTRRRRN